MAQSPQPWFIRTAVVADVPALQQLQSEGWFKDYADYIPDGYGQFSMKQYGDPRAIRHNIETDDIYLVAEQAGQVIGTICGVKLNETEAEIWWLHVAAQARAQGIGRGLINHFAAQLPAAIHWLYVTTFDGYLPTIRFYEQAGFLPYERIPREFEGIPFQDLRLRIPVAALVQGSPT